MGMTIIMAVSRLFPSSPLLLHTGPLHTDTYKSTGLTLVDAEWQDPQGKEWKGAQGQEHTSGSLSQSKSGTTTTTVVVYRSTSTG